MYYVGVDLHKRHSWFYVINETGEKVSSKSISNEIAELKEYLSTIPKPFKLAVEATYNWYFLVDIAREYAIEVYLANSYELKAFAKRNKKTDKIDARLIADILMKGYLPTVTIPDKKTRDIREILKHRTSLVRDRGRVINRFKALIDRHGEISEGNFTTLKKLNQLSDIRYHTWDRIVTNGNIEHIKFLNGQIKVSEAEIKLIAEKDPDIMNLITIDGLDYFSATLVKSEIIDINRFSTFNRLCAYSGLAPRVYKSADTCIYGPLNVNRRKNLQWILIENVYHFIRANSDRRKRYLQIKKRKSSNAAKIVMAREFLRIIYYVLKEKRPYYINKPVINKVQSEAGAALCGV